MLGPHLLPTVLDLPHCPPKSRPLQELAGGACVPRNSPCSVHKPEVGYCQSMNYVAAMLLLGMDLDEEKAFWAMVALIDDNGGPHREAAASASS